MRSHSIQYFHPVGHREYKVYAAALLTLVVGAFGALQLSLAGPTWQPAAAIRLAPVASTETAWQKFSIAEQTPEILRRLNIPALNFQNLQQLPIARIDGSVFNGKLPETLWVKLDQPGNTILIAETDAGIFVKVLEDASPGFASPCRLSPHGFGTDQGEPIYFDRDSLLLKALWVVQDASAVAGRVPGWIQVPQDGVVAARR